MADQHLKHELITSRQAEFDALRNVSDETPCPYLTGLSSRSELYYAEQLEAPLYERLLARGFRRSGRIIYRPRCRNCQECRQIRILTDRFRPTRSMRRVLRVNADIRAHVEDPVPTDEKFEVFCRYLDHQHDDTMSRSYESFVDFLYDSPMETHEISYRLGDRTVGVSVVDRCPGGLSSVYMYFDPYFATRSLGTYSILWEVEYCRTHHLPYYYLGYYVSGSRTMAYKSRFRPNQVLVGDDYWMTFQE